MTKKELKLLINQIIIENKYKLYETAQGRGTKIIGYVGNEKVEAYIFPGKDADLSYYIYKGKKYFGIVKFTREEKRTTFKY